MRPEYYTLWLVHFFITNLHISILHLLIWKILHHPLWLPVNTFLTSTSINNFKVRTTKSSWRVPQWLIRVKLIFKSQYSTVEYNNQSLIKKTQEDKYFLKKTKLDKMTNQITASLLWTCLQHVYNWKAGSTHPLCPESEALACTSSWCARWAKTASLWQHVWRRQPCPLPLPFVRDCFVLFVQGWTHQLAQPSCKKVRQTLLHFC